MREMRSSLIRREGAHPPDLAPAIAEAFTHLERLEVQKCLILAAGEGSRLRVKVDSKPLYPLLGVPLIERVIRTAREVGLDDFYVVVGHERDRLVDFLDALAERLKVSITTVPNEGWHRYENGFSILQAEEYLDEPFLLLMADHIFEPSILEEMMDTALREDEIALAVDGDLHNPLVDLTDVTRVWQRSGRIQRIGKAIGTHNGFDTGVFLCTPVLFDALKSCHERGETGLSAAVQHLAENGRVAAVSASGRFWVDVDDPAAVRRAEAALTAQFRQKPNDGPVSRSLNRPLSSRLSRLLAHSAVTPNQISVFSFVLSLIGAGLFVLGSYPALALGGVLAQVASIIDGCDGEIARLKYLGSEYGGWLDAVLDRYADALLLFGLTWHLYVQGKAPAVLFVGFLAIIGSFMVSYTADKYDSLMQERIYAGRWPALRVGRDIRVFLIFLGAVTAQIFPVLAIIAALMNGETVRRILVCREA